MKICLLLVSYVLFVTTVSVRAHELRHVVRSDDAVVVELSYGDGTAFAGQDYRLYRPDELVPFQSGKTDLRGRIVFVPDRDGSWRVQAFSTDGHGVDFTFELNDMRIPDDTHEGIRVPWMKIVVGAAFIFGVFGIITLFSKRKSV